MHRLNKKTIGGIALATIIVAGMFVFMPSASADLAALDKFGTIINILTMIQNTVINIQNLLLDPNFGLEEIKREVIIIESNVTSPEHGLKEIKREVRNIESNVTSSLFGLKEIKREVNNIEGNVTSPDFGLEEIKREVNNIEGNITSSIFGLEEIKNEVRNIEGNVTDPVFGLEEIKNEVRNIEGNITSSIFGLAEIKREIIGIEGNITSSDFGLEAIDNSQYVPFKATTSSTGTCAEAGGGFDFDGIAIASAATTGDFIITGVAIEPSGIDQASDSIQVIGYQVDTAIINLTTVDLTGTLTTSSGFDVMGSSLITGGTFPHQIAAASAGAGDISMIIFCNASTTSNITFSEPIIVSGWKQADDTITVTYLE